MEQVVDQLGLSVGIAGNHLGSAAMRVVEVGRVSQQGQIAIQEERLPLELPDGEAVPVQSEERAATFLCGWGGCCLAGWRLFATVGPT